MQGRRTRAVAQNGTESLFFQLVRKRRLKKRLDQSARNNAKKEGGYKSGRGALRFQRRGRSKRASVTSIVNLDYARGIVVDELSQPTSRNFPSENFQVSSDMGTSGVVSLPHFLHSLHM